MLGQVLGLLQLVLGSRSLQLSLPFLRLRLSFCPVGLHRFLVSFSLSLSSLLLFLLDDFRSFSIPLLSFFATFFLRLLAALLTRVRLSDLLLLSSPLLLLGLLLLASLLLLTRLFLFGWILFFHRKPELGLLAGLLVVRVFFHRQTDLRVLLARLFETQFRLRLKFCRFAPGPETLLILQTETYLSASACLLLATRLRRPQRRQQRLLTRPRLGIGCGRPSRLPLQG